MVVLFLSVNVNFIILHGAIASMCTLPISKVPFSLPVFVNVCNEGQAKVGVFDY